LRNRSYCPRLVRSGAGRAAAAEIANVCNFGGRITPEPFAATRGEDGPVFLLGACVLVDAVWAAVGDDPLSDVLGVLLPVLAAAVPGVDSQVAADALVGAFSTEYRCEQPGDDEVLGRVRSYGGDALENLPTADAVPPSDVLRVGLTILSALAQLCRSESPSVLQQAA
jgi:hypothetical protein